MRKKAVLYAIYIFLIVLIQSTIMDYFKFYNVKGNLLLIFTVAVALLRGSAEGAAVGFFSGLALDMISGRSLGFNALISMYTGLVIGLVNRRIYRGNYFVTVLFTMVTSLIYEAIVYALRILPSKQADFPYVLKNVIFPEAIYNSIVTIFIFIAAIKLNKLIEKYEYDARKY